MEQSNTEYYIKVYESSIKMKEAVLEMILNDTLFFVVHIGDPLDCDINKIKRMTNCTTIKSYTAKINKMTGGSKYCIIFRKYKSKKYLKKLKLKPNQLK